MQPFIFISGKKILRYGIIALSTTCMAGLIYAEKDYAKTVFSSTNEKPSGAIYSVKTSKKQLALTFDISWGEERIQPILNVLEEQGIKKATFFLSSPWSEANPELVKQIAQRYEVGSHGHRHDNYSKYSEKKINEQINKADKILTSLLGKKPTLIRYPNGDFDKRVLRVAAQLGYTSIQWDTDSLDWTNPGKDVIVKRVLTRAHPGDIILLHASDSSRQTHEALPAIIDNLKKQGYEFVTVSELIAGADVKPDSVD